MFKIWNVGLRCQVNPRFTYYILLIFCTWQIIKRCIYFLIRDKRLIEQYSTKLTMFSRQSIWVTEGSQYYNNLSRSIIIQLVFKILYTVISRYQLTFFLSRIMNIVIRRFCPCNCGRWFDIIKLLSVMTCRKKWKSMFKVIFFLDAYEMLMPLKLNYYIMITVLF